MRSALLFKDDVFLVDDDAEKGDANEGGKNWTYLNSTYSFFQWRSWGFEFPFKIFAFHQKIFGWKFPSIDKNWDIKIT